MASQGKNAFLGTEIADYGEEPYTVRFSRFLDFLFSLEGREFVVAACHIRGMSNHETALLLHLHKSTISLMKQAILPQWRQFVEDLHEKAAENEEEADAAPPGQLPEDRFPHGPEYGD